MKAYTICSGRPIGRHNRIYIHKPEVGFSPYGLEVEEWDSVTDAFNAILDYDPGAYPDSVKIITALHVKVGGEDETIGEK